MDLCYICNAELHKFMITPILELPDGTWKQCCAECADKEFPGWETGDSLKDE